MTILNDFLEKELEEFDELGNFWKGKVRQLAQKLVAEIKEKVERIKLDMDIVVCDCGEPYKDSDPADLVNDLLSHIQERVEGVENNAG